VILGDRCYGGSRLDFLLEARDLYVSFERQDKVILQDHQNHRRPCEFRIRCWEMVDNVEFEDFGI